MTTNHPITPPPELVQQLYGLPQMRAIEKAYQAGADQEFEAVIDLIKDHEWFADPSYRIAELRAARRPKPPSLKEEATAAIVRLSKKYPGYEGADIETIRRAIEALPND
jgi:hypothetical protein